MPLPKLDVPIYELNLPSTNKELKYRPFLVKEERVLLLALEGTAGPESDSVPSIGILSNSLNN